MKLDLQLMGPISTRIVESSFFTEECFYFSNVPGFLVSRQAVDKGLSIALFQKTVVQQRQDTTVFHRTNQAAKSLLQSNHGRRHLIFKKSIASGGINRAYACRHHRIIRHSKWQPVDNHA